jgi:hypothetical protein
VKSAEEKYPVRGRVLPDGAVEIELLTDVPPLAIALHDAHDHVRAYAMPAAGKLTFDAESTALFYLFDEIRVASSTRSASPTTSKPSSS